MHEVWRIFNAVDRSSTQPEQITYYDDGVGTDNLRLLRLLGGAFGWGLKRNIREAYEFLAMTYEPDDKIFLFGFSRGAFTMRSLAGLICRCGLLTRHALIGASRRARMRMVHRVIDAYRREVSVTADDSHPTHPTHPTPLRRTLRIDDMDLQTVPIHFVGVWDTVDAIGVPFDELKAVDDLYRFAFKKRLWKFHDHIPHHGIHYAYQALALDDERRTFHPDVWHVPNTTEDPSVAPDQVVEQVWFAGVHSNVGGGYPKDSLALVPLLWMMTKARRCGLHFLNSKWQEYREAADAHGRMYDSRTGFGMFYRYAPRKPYEDTAVVPAIHKSVLQRRERATDYYAPKVLRNGQWSVVPE